MDRLKTDKQEKQTLTISPSSPGPPTTLRYVQRDIWENASSISGREPSTDSKGRTEQLLCARWHPDLPLAATNLIVYFAGEVSIRSFGFSLPLYRGVP